MTRLLATLSLVAVTAVAGCGSRDPFAGITRLSEAPELAPVASDDAAVAAAVTANMVATPESARPTGLGGLFGLFRRGNDDAKPETPEPAAQPAAEGAPATETREPARAGFFGRLFGGGSDGGTPEPARAPADTGLEPGTKIALGEVGRVCNLPNKDRGTRIATQAGFTLYDTFPNSTSSRPFYLTGFSDGCARQVTGALVMFGDAAIHERHLYSQRRPTYMAVDSAYEQIKSRVCRVGHGKPCGDKITRLNRTVAFVTVYPRFETSGTWAELLLSSRKVQAVTLRD